MTGNTGNIKNTGSSGNGVFWVILLASALLEAVWATALGLSNGFTQLMPTVVFAITAVLSMLGLGIAVKRIPLGTAYAVWVGIGAALTVGWAMITGVESASPLKLLFIAGIVGCAAGLKALPADKAAAKAE
ncbi:ligand-binding protein SH3 [Paenarthrobacter nitroguajacolicus]|uniref:DMT family transporter n=1 Tax=Paenarthrobacter nitroguajacolicus TaxID=211146 RepID=UPI0015BD43F8|nr:multidrug efflux SMR transporter [Paenarthrobacter nitroguajacolicus]NWL12561.1 ligand-binding protein SH3 [Paenarthrobacter nitroguajacolicus]